MSLNKLSISYRCHNAIGNSLNLTVMIKEFIKTFIMETEAAHGSFYQIRNDEYKNFIAIGKKIEVESLVLKEALECDDVVIKPYTASIFLIAFKLNSGCMLFLYHKQSDFKFIASIFESLKQRLEIAIDACLNVQELKKRNKELENLTSSLKYKVDISTKENLEKEKQIFEQLKMAQMGELIGNIAHQWRQPLSIISTAASGMKIKKELEILKDEDFVKYIDSIVENSLYLSNTIDEFRDYIKDSNKEKEIIVQERLKMAVSLIESPYKLNNISIIAGNIEKENIHFKVVLGDLLQVLISIFNNAKDALTLNNVKDRWVKYELIKKDYLIQITIEDSAGGIPEEIIDKIFNPYFTTKHQYQGTGIGLYSSYDIIVKKLKGRLFVKNTEFGAKFFIELPLNINYVI